MNQPVVRKASRQKARLRLGISAPSGAGKTLGSLLLGYGIMRATYPDAPDAAIWEKIGIIDTEEGSGELYVGVEKHGIVIGEYAYTRISAPYTAIKYLEAQRAQERHGCENIIHDSLTHAWAGTGGLLDKQGKLADSMKNSYTAWRYVTPDHTALVDAMLQSPAHITATMRSKVEYAMQTGMNGKQQVIKLGMAPIQREGMEYEFTAFFDVSMESVATATKDRTDLFSTVTASGRLEKREFMITPAIGAELFGWLNKGIDAPPTIERLAEGMAEYINHSNNLAETYAELQGSFDRIRQERPEWEAMLMSLFDARHAELTGAAKV